MHKVHLPIPDRVVCDLQVKGETERHERLVEIQSKLEQSGFTKIDSPIVSEFNGVSTGTCAEKLCVARAAAFSQRCNCTFLFKDHCVSNHEYYFD